MPSQLSSILYDKVKDYATSRAIQYMNENYSHGPTALDAVDQNVRELLLDVQVYHARFTVATEAMLRERSSSIDYLMTCDKVVAASELGNVQRIIGEIRSISEISSDLEARAIQRVRSQKQHLRRELDENIRTLERMERFNDTVEQQARMASNIRNVRNYLDLYRQNEITIYARGKTLQEICAEMIALLTSIKDTLRENQSGYVYFARDCMDWERSRIAEGF